MFSGVFPALFTPFSADDHVDVAALEKLIKYVLDGGVNGLYITGSTGEGFSMTEEERRLVAEVTVKTVAHQIPVIVQVGAIATGVCQRLAAPRREDRRRRRLGSSPLLLQRRPAGCRGSLSSDCAGVTSYRSTSTTSPAPPASTSAPTWSRRLVNDGVIQGLKFTDTNRLWLPRHH